jgi:hypothetical protein
MNEYVGDTTQSGIVMLPKRHSDVSTYEIARFLKYNGDAVEYVTFHVPRKEGGPSGKTVLFQEDIYAPMASGKPTNIAEKWFKSTDSENPPNLISIKPSNMASIYETPESEGGKRRTESSGDLNIPTSQQTVNTKSSSSDGLKYEIVHSSYVSVMEDEYSRDQFQKRHMALCTATSSKSNRVFIAYGNDSNNIIQSKSSKIIEMDQVVAVQRCKQLRDLNFGDEQCFEIFVEPEKVKKNQPTLTVHTIACANRQECSQWLEAIAKRKVDTKKKKKTIYSDFILELVPANGDDVPVSYWAKRWVVALPDQLLVFPQRKSFNPKEHFATVKKRKEYNGPLPTVVSMDMIDHAPGVTLSNEEKKLAFRFVLSDKSEIFMMFTNDIQKELWAEDILIKIGKIARKKDADQEDVQTLLKSLGLFDHDSNKVDDDSDDENEQDTGKKQNKFLKRLRKEEKMEAKQAEAEGSGKLDVYPVSVNMSSEDIQSLFSAFGDVEQVELHRDGKFKDHAIVTYKKKSDSLQALALNGSVLDSERISIETIADTDMRNPGYLKIEEVNTLMTKKDFYDMFDAFGQIEYIKLWPVTKGKDTSNTGYIKFRDLESAQMAVNLSGATVFGKPLTIVLIEADSLSAAAEEKLFTNQIDPQEVKAQRQTILIQIKGDKRIRSRRVEMTLESLNAGDVFVLDCGSKIYQWNGKQATRFKKARGLDVASNIRLKERGGNAKIFFLEQEADDDVENSEEMKEFWSYFGISKGAKLKSFRDVPINSAEKGGDDTQFEQYIDNHTKLYRVSAVENEDDMDNLESGSMESRIQIRLVHKGSQPSKAMFRSEYVYLLDCFTELFIWEGKESNKDQKTFAKRMAIKLEQQDKRPVWTGTTKVIQNGETVLFKEKLSDYAGVLPIAVSSSAIDENSGGGGNVAQKKPQPTIDLQQFAKDHNRPKDKEPMFDYDSSESQTNSKFGGNLVSVDVWVVDGFEKTVYPTEMLGQFFSADSFVILVTYRRLNKDKRLVYFWQGRDCSINEKGASALLTVDVSNITQDDAPQIRITQQHETRHFLHLFPNQMITIHSGKYLERKGQKPKNTLVYDIRSLSECLDDQIGGTFKTRAIECVSNETIDGGLDLSNRLNANHVCLVANPDYSKFFIHIGENSIPSEKQAALNLAKTLTDNNCFITRKIKTDIVEIKQGAETEEFCKLLNIKDKKKLNFGKTSRSVPRMFSFSGITGVVEVDRIFNFCQDDLDLTYCLFIDCIDRSYLWMSTAVITPSDQKIILEAAISYFRKTVDEPIPGDTKKAKAYMTNRGKDVDSNILIVNPCQEPLEFTKNFQGWNAHRSRYLTDLLAMLMQGQGGSSIDYATPSLVKKVEVKRAVNLSREMSNAVERLDDYTRKTYPYEVLLRTPLPIGVDSSKLEQYLSLEEFESVFGMTKATFDKSPVWKQEKMKKQFYLF